MKTLAAAVSLAAFASAAIAADDNPFAAFKGKMKEGMYDMTMEMDMGQVPGMPPGMGKRSHKVSHCVTQQDIDKGALGKGRDGKGMPDNCKISDFKMGGNTASYHMECTGERAMSADNQITFLGNGYDMNMRMKMAMGKGGQPVEMAQKIQSRYTGPCTGAK
jgi:Protein of unknown function (DUF3617)